MAPKRSTQLIIIGASVFVIGAGLVFLGLRSSKPSEAKSAPRAAAAPSTNANAQTAGRVVAQGTAAPVPLTLPKGLTAVAVHLDTVAGLSGHVTPGDLINLYATVKSGDKTKGLEPPYSKLFLTNVRVLDVTGVAPDGSGDPTLLLALNPAQAEQAIFFAKFESLWAALVPPSQPAAVTAGTDYANDLQKR
jgi:Flp pilus assembly protein RcpC/CpaB